MPRCMLRPMKLGRPRAPQGPEAQYDPDAELAKSFAVGCGVLLVLFLIGWALIAYFWLH
jgi:hypothetical protein